MNYYKIIDGETFVGVATQKEFRRYQQKHNVLLACDEDEAQYVQCSDVLYRADWMVPVVTGSVDFKTITLIRIEQDEYDVLLAAVESGEEVVVEPEESAEVEDETPVDENEQVTVEYVREKKIAEMSNACNTVITNGFDVALSDNETHHFSLTTQDQLNLITISTLVASGETQIPYHADDELCKFYSSEDITTIINAATSFKTYHVSYFNALKAYIESMSDISSIGVVEYGVGIPDEYQSEVLKVLLTQQAGDAS